MAAWWQGFTKALFLHKFCPHVHFIAAIPDENQHRATKRKEKSSFTGHGKATVGIKKGYLLTYTFHIKPFLFLFYLLCFMGCVSGYKKPIKE